MSILAKLATIIGALLFFTIVVVVGLAFIDYIESGHEKTVRGGPRRRSFEVGQSTGILNKETTRN
jgi:hypothetical protein